MHNMDPGKASTPWAFEYNRYGFFATSASVSCLANLASIKVADARWLHTL